MDSLPREVVGPKTRRQVWSIESDVILRHEAGVPVGTFFSVYAVNSKPTKPPRKGNFSLKIRRGLMEAADRCCAGLATSARARAKIFLDIENQSETVEFPGIVLIGNSGSLLSFGRGLLPEPFVFICDGGWK